MAATSPPTVRPTAQLCAAAIAVLTVVTVARLDLVAALADQGRFDKYLFFARRILAGELPVERLGDLSAGYLWTVTGLLAIGVGPLGIRTLQVVAVSVAAALCGDAAGRRWGSLAAVVAALAVLGSRGALVNATELEPETLILLLHAIAVWLLMTRTGPAGRCAAGVVLGLSAVTRPTILAPACGIAAWLAWSAWRDSRTAAAGRAATRVAGLGAVLFAAGMVASFGAVRLAYAAFPGGATPMNPGTVLYEGLNPSTAGYSGEAPMIVKEIEFGLDEPDALHVAYRIVAARALASTPRAQDTNRFWSDRAAAFVRLEPRAAARLVATKLLLACMSYEAWDLKSMAMRDLELGSRLWLPFGLALALAILGTARARPARDVVPIALLAAGPLLTMVVFYVSSRQRNSLLPPVALLAAAGVATLVTAWRAGRRREAAVLALVIAALGAILSLDGPIQREDRWGWIVRAARDQALDRVAAARSRDDETAARRWQSEAALCAAPIPDSTVARLVGAEVRHRLGVVTDPAERFDLALAARRCGDLTTAARTLRRLVEVGYRPRRGVQYPPSVAFQLADIALRQEDTDEARRWLTVAQAEAPGVAEVLALAVVVGTADSAAAEQARHELGELHDPFTGSFALARAHAAAGDSETAERLVTAIAEAIPEWSRPREWLAGGHS